MIPGLLNDATTGATTEGYYDPGLSNLGGMGTDDLETLVSPVQEFRQMGFYIEKTVVEAKAVP